MFCRNCGFQYVNPAAVICTSCNAPKGEGGYHCQACGASTVPGAFVCMGCGGKLAIKGAKSKVVAGILGIMIGAYGVHNFYLGYTGKAIAQLLISILSFFTLAPFVMIWGLVEGIFILTGKIDTDANGVPLSD
ncbi:MAG: TM2 domain-containing protein [Oscillospiraceae bacterium]|nr:TM2 domain-containing protein [Oscillospiraceae bacterium]